MFKFVFFSLLLKNMLHDFKVLILSQHPFLATRPLDAKSLCRAVPCLLSWGNLLRWLQGPCMTSGLLCRRFLAQWKL